MDAVTLVIPAYDPAGTQAYPGGVTPGHYTLNQVVELLREHAGEPDVVTFIADMLEE
ncbi:MAG: hypothetical protein HY683_02260 [Chloroflexi bacterium]|nr:hypothetical protein [Chloroflexota bacterium]